MAVHPHPAPVRLGPQGTKRPSGHRTIPAKASERPNHLRTAGAKRHPRVAEVEGLVECLMALCTDADVLGEGTRILIKVTSARSTIEAELASGQLELAGFEQNEKRLAYLEGQVIHRMARRYRQLHAQVIPEVKDCYKHSEFVS